MIGGPAVGDIRSRCLRLSDQSTSEALAVHKLIGHRLPLDAQAAKLEWYNENFSTVLFYSVFTKYYVLEHLATLTTLIMC